MSGGTCAGRRRCRGDEGAGLVSTMFGILVFLLFLLLACQLLVGLFARTVASDAAMLGAQRLARGAQADDAYADVDQAVGDALLGAGEVPDEQDPTRLEYVRYRVRMRAPRLLGAPWLGPWATDEIVRDGRARVERRR